ncbi:COG1361 S-layer family protein [Thermococcus sp.]
MKRLTGVLIGLMLLSSMMSYANAADNVLLFEGYIDRGEALLVGPLVISLVDTQKDYLHNEYYAFIAVVKDGKVLNAEYKVIYVPNPDKMKELLSDPLFLMAMADTMGYNLSKCAVYENNTPLFINCISSTQAAFYSWLQNAPPEELGEAVVKTIEEHPELGLRKQDVLMPVTYPNITPIKENETITVNVDGQEVDITALAVYPNGAKISISGPVAWRVSTAPALITTSVSAPETVNPGDTVTIKVHLKNEGALKARYVSVFVSPTPLTVNQSSSIGMALSQVLTQSGISQGVWYPEGSAVQYVEYLDGKEEKTLEFKIKVNENAQPGVYPLYVSVVYFAPVGIEAQIKMIQSFNYVGITVARENDATFVIKNITKPQIVHPGDDFRLSLTLENAGGEEAKDVLVQIQPQLEVPSSTEELKNMGHSPIMVANGSSEVYFPMIYPQSSEKITFNLHVSEDAKTGSYPLKVMVKYYSGDAKDGKEQTFVFSVKVVEKREGFIEIERVEVAPEKISPGDSFTVKFVVRNTGEEPVKALSLKILSYKVPVQGEVKKVDLSALSQLPIKGSSQLAENLQTALNQIMQELARQDVDAFLPIGEDNVRYLSGLEPGQNATLEFRIKANSQLETGIYPLRIELSYLTAPDDQEVKDERLVGIDVTGKEKLVISKISTSPERVLPGTSNVEISLEVENIGTGVARTVLLKPLPKEPFRLSGTSEQIINLGDLGRGESAKASFLVDVADNATSGRYELPVEVTYTDSIGNELRVNLSVPVIISSKPNIQIASVKFSPEPLQGKDIKVYLTLKNVGGEKAESVIVEGVVRASQPFTLTKRTDYVGTLEPGKEGQGVIEMSIDSNAIPKDYRVLIRIRAVGDKAQGDDNVYVFERTIDIPVKENTRTKANLKLLGVLVAMAFVIAVLYTYRKRSNT